MQERNAKRCRREELREMQERDVERDVERRRLHNKSQPVCLMERMHVSFMKAPPLH